jgi:hypothetical protein
LHREGLDLEVVDFQPELSHGSTLRWNETALSLRTGSTFIFMVVHLFCQQCLKEICVNDTVPEKESVHRASSRLPPLWILRPADRCAGRCCGVVGLCMTSAGFRVQTQTECAD